MKAYIGTKIIQAEPAWSKDGEDGYKVVYPDGYVSWSPKDTFEEAYREVSDKEKALIADVETTRVFGGRLPLAEFERWIDEELILRKSEFPYPMDAAGERILGDHHIVFPSEKEDNTNQTTDEQILGTGYYKSLLEEAENH